MAGRAGPWRAAAAAGVILPCNSSSPQNSGAMQSTRGPLPHCRCGALQGSLDVTKHTSVGYVFPPSWV